MSPPSNVPYDWDRYWYRCSECGSSYHAADGGCDCYLEKIEEAWEETLQRLQDAKIDLVEEEDSGYGAVDDVLTEVGRGEKLIRVYITEEDGEDELLFTKENWSEAVEHLELDKPEYTL